ncbi:phospholipase D family protein [Variovorax sp. J22P240]|uniref:phospholipase D family protein n=1 Tax=unclassified Variovorax TaxID=663243 RepID=UPI0025784E9A|nr:MULTISPECIES: phospholipase D family protein [unclassified Variovorax]MDM0000671.1 phospholipase D family protein [Variovorax sp. J22P240]MDM0053962.1 phospholipase D family protein [Variovorax sp. J22R115]
MLALQLGLVLGGCASLPDQVSKTGSITLANTDDTRLARDVRNDMAAHPAKSGIHPLQNAEDAFAARIVLARRAERSLDLQYYIWRRDTTGELMFEAVWQAAERGVRIRLLLDDANTSGLDPTLAALNAHANIEVRLFNPFANRGFRVGDFALDFSRLNRRMHNKSFTADNQVSIVGGRNIGDEYFGANMEIGFQDLDVLVVGPVVQQVSDQFDLFWNSPSAYPASSLLPRSRPGATEMLRQSWEKVHSDPQAQRYVEAVRRTPLLGELDQHSVGFEWTSARVLHDDPAKVLEPTDRSDLQMLPQLLAQMGQPKLEVDLVSPYFVPGRRGTDDLVKLAQSGVKVRVLTNSLAATDVAPVHAGYAKYRKELLEGGVTIYELKPGIGVAGPDRDADWDIDAARRGPPGSGGSQGSSAASLHAKTFAVDRERIFVGSFNLDPRSSRLNTEMGVVIDSPVLAGQLHQMFETRTPQDAYHVQLTPDGNGMEWVESGPHGATRHTFEPGASPLKLLYLDLLEALPIEWML